MKIPQDQVRSARMEMIPLMDCMFLILVSFVYAFLGMTQNRGIPVALPQAAVQAVPETETSFTITVQKDGVVFLNKEPCEVERLGPAIAAEYKPGETTILLQGDVAALHGRVVEVLDALRRAGISKVAIQTALPSGQEMESKRWGQTPSLAPETQAK